MKNWNCERRQQHNAQQSQSIHNAKWWTAELNTELSDDVLCVQKHYDFYDYFTTAPLFIQLIIIIFHKLQCND